MSKLFLLVTFFLATPFFLLFCTLILLSVSYQKQQDSLAYTAPAHNISYAALPTNQTTFATNIQPEDARVEMVRQFFAKYHSPLEPYAQDVVLAADMYDLDFRLIPAIAMQESNLCKNEPEGSYNCWGFGIYDKQVKRFDDYHQAINAVTKTLAHEYKNKGLDTPDEIMTKYTPQSNGSWAFAVNHFMDQLQ